MKPATRKGLAALIVILLGANIAVVVVRQRRSDRTRVSVAPGPSTTATTASPTTETTMAPATLAPDTLAPDTSVAPTITLAPANAPTIPDVGSSTVVTSTVPLATAIPAPASEHPNTGGYSLSPLALALVALGLMGLRFARRPQSRSNR